VASYLYFVLLRGHRSWSWMSLSVRRGPERAEGYFFESVWGSYASYLWLVDYFICRQMRAWHMGKPL
jgi:hypothetical protein